MAKYLCRRICEAWLCIARQGEERFGRQGRGLARSGMAPRTLRNIGVRGFERRG